MPKENAGAEPREKAAIAFPLTVAAIEKGREIREAISKGETVTLEPAVVNRQTRAKVEKMRFR